MVGVGIVDVGATEVVGIVELLLITVLELATTNNVDSEAETVAT